MEKINYTTAEVNARLALVDSLSAAVQTPFLPSIYDSTKSATTSVAGQSEACATGAKVLCAENLSVSNVVYIGLGQSQSEAEANAASGVNNVTRFKLPTSSGPCYINIANYSFYSWLGGGATVSVHLVQGV
jgi:hypothetical protein